MSGSKPYTPGEGLMMRAVDEDDVEGHGMSRGPAPRATEDDVEGHSGRGPAPRATEDEDTEGHWMPDAGSSMRLAKSRNSDIEREARQHQLANEARQNRLEQESKRTHQKG